MQLLQDVNPLVPGGADLTPLLVIAGIWSIVGIAFYVWYLWSLSKLFPHLGLKSAWGWIPVWNQWQLLQRGGLPGWLVLLVLVPGLGALVVLIVTIIAIHRINTEFGKGAGMTLLGVVLAPLWAMLLANHITDGRYGAAAGWAPVRDGAGADAGYGAGASALQGLPHANVPPQQPAYGAAGNGAPQSYAPQPYAPQAQGYAPRAFQQQGGQPQNVEPQGFEPQNFEPQYEQQPQRSVFAPPANAQNGQQQGSQPQGAHGVPAAGTPQQGDPVHTSTAVPGIPAVPAPEAPAAVQSNWGFSNTTEGAYERLAAEGTQAPGAAPLGAQVAQQPFSWPAPHVDAAAPVSPEAPVRQPVAAPGPQPVTPQAPQAAQVPEAPQSPVAPQAQSYADAASAGNERPAQGLPSPQTAAELLGMSDPQQVTPAQADPAQASPEQPAPVQAVQPGQPTQPAPGMEAAAPTRSQPDIGQQHDAQPNDTQQSAYDESATFSGTGPSHTAPAPRGLIDGAAADPALAVAPVAPVAPTAPGLPVAGGLAAAAGIVAAAPVAPTAPTNPEAFAQLGFADGAPASDAQNDDFEDDHTVVVRRETRWGLELPDGEVLELVGHDVVVGRRPEPAGAYEVLKINDPTRTLSKSHVRMRRTGEVWTIEDLHSTNGVALIDENGATIELDAGHERGTTERMLIGTLEVRLVRVS